MSGDTKSGGESHSFVDDRTEFDRGFQEGIFSAYRNLYWDLPLVSHCAVPAFSRVPQQASMLPCVLS